ncbi:hypothetical protein L7F22_009046, partial [Adiantum nelumboides]|nr:hypothetical protein [Adiantum nelumboides]
PLKAVDEKSLDVKTLEEARPLDEQDDDDKDWGSNVPAMEMDAKIDNCVEKACKRLHDLRALRCNNVVRDGMDVDDNMGQRV